MSLLGLKKTELVLVELHAIVGRFLSVYKAASLKLAKGSTQQALLL